MALPSRCVSLAKLGQGFDGIVETIGDAIGLGVSFAVGLCVAVEESAGHCHGVVVSVEVIASPVTGVGRTM